MRLVCTGAPSRVMSASVAAQQHGITVSSWQNLCHKHMLVDTGSKRDQNTYSTATYLVTWRRFVKQEAVPAMCNARYLLYLHAVQLS
jgi:hypothetical protein